MEKIYLVVGKSGVGKTTVIEKLVKDHGFVPVVSMTDRPKRYEAEDNHIFLSKEEFDKIPQEDLCAFTCFAGNRYGVTKDIIDSCDLYAIDPAGVLYMKERYKGKKGMKTILLKADKEELVRRMRARGDSEENIEKRLVNDDVMFDPKTYPVQYDLEIDVSNLSPDEVAKRMFEFICASEAEEKTENPFSLKRLLEICQGYETPACVECPFFGELQCQRALHSSVAQYIDELEDIKRWAINYVLNDLDAAEPDYVRDALEQAGCPAEKWESLGLGFLNDGEEVF